MSVIIDESCITCDACMQNCPVNAIVDDAHNPLGLARYYVQPEKCVECVGIHEDPQCAAICPSIGCITWDLPFTAEHLPHFQNSPLYQLGAKQKPKTFRTDIPLAMRGVKKEVQVAPEQEVG